MLGSVQTQSLSPVFIGRDAELTGLPPRSPRRTAASPRRC